MAVKIQFDNTHNAIEPTLVLATRKGRKIGKLPAHNIVFKDGLNVYSELSFKVFEADCEKNDSLWEQLTDFKLLWVREWNRWFEIYVESNETSYTVKNISAISLGEAELSQINLYGIEINTETDISRDDYKPTVIYKGNDPSASLLTRIMEKAPHYTIKHVDSSIANMQRTFTFDNKSLYDAFQEISEEMNCLFSIDCYSDMNGSIVREISVYDLEANCLDCGERGEFTAPCSKCGSGNILNGYGEDTSIFISTDNLADEITYTTDNGSVKNCFRLEAGDDLMTATIANCNPNGSSYIWHIPNAVKSDMSVELVQKLEQYDRDYAYYYDVCPINISGDTLNTYNKIVQKYKVYTDNYNEIHSPIVGYSNLMEAYYNTIDFHLFLNSSLMPSIEMSDTNAAKEAGKLSSSSLSPVAVKSLNTCSSATAASSVLGMAKAIINSRFQVKISESSFSCDTWTGTFIITNYADEKDTFTTNRITVRINDNYAEYVRQKIKKALKKSESGDEVTDVVQLFGLEDSAFVSELKKYSLARLISFYDSCQNCIDILTEQGIANNQTWADRNPNLYESLYIPYYNKLGYIEEEIKIRENEIAIIIGSFDSEGERISHGMQTLLNAERNEIHKKLNFEEYIGSDLWLEFSAYRREDTYRNDNYISDGLNNAELFENARKFIEVAQKEIYKSATLQHSISASLKNLLVIKEFDSIVDYFEVGNWIRIKTDNGLYRLRLLEYEIDFENLSSISVTFSDVSTIRDGTSDLNSIINQAASIASSYSSTKHQAQKGFVSKNRLDDWVQKGLNTTNIKIISSADNQNQTWDSHGMLFREYDPVTETYDDCQLKIINSTLAITDDNWKTTKTAVGGSYYFNPATGKMEYAYGVNAEVLTGKLILGESLGICSENNSLTFDKNGLFITNGTNHFRVNPDNANLLVLSNSTGDILWVDDNGGLHITGDGSGLDISSNDTVSDMHSRIEQLPHSISLSVDNGALGSKASIVLDIDGNKTSESIDLSNVRKSFANDTSNIAISAGTIAFNSNTLIVNSSNFKLDSEGVITATSGNFSGSITGSTITGSSITSTNGKVSIAIDGGRLHGGNGGDNGYVSFNTYYVPTGIYGARLAGIGCVALLTPYLGVGSYTDMDSDAIITIGQTGNIQVVTDVSINEDGSISRSYKTLHFEKGLMTTAI